MDEQQIAVEVTQDSKDVFQSIRRCGELAGLEFVEELEFAISARDRPKIASILKRYPNASIVHKLLVNYVPRD